jgi:multidrug efflux pump subunit AcrA (membrane-fusion protein)
VQWDGSQHIVFLATLGGGSTDDPNDYLLEAQPVTIGTMLDDYTEILSGLAEGDQIVADGSHMLKSELTRRLTQKAD